MVGLSDGMISRGAVFKAWIFPVTECGGGVLDVIDRRRRGEQKCGQKTASAIKIACSPTRKATAHKFVEG